MGKDSDRSNDNDRSGGGYSQKDASRDTKSSGKDTSRAWHDARDKASKSSGWGVPKDRHK